MIPQRKLRPEPASFYAKKLGLRLERGDFEIESFRPLSALPEQSHSITYLSSSRFASSLEGRSGLTVITRPELSADIPEGNSVLLVDSDPRNAFYAALESAICAGLFESLEHYVSPRARIAPSAVISANVQISDDAEIGAGVVILPNTHIGAGVVIKPNAVIGGDGFEPTSWPERRVVKHAGGVWIDEGVHVGACNCIDKGLFGDFTVAGAYTLMDNMVHLAHSVRTGRGCSITASVEISGSVKLGDGVWLGPRTAISQGLSIGDHSYLGTGSVVTRDLPAHSLAYGSPAKRTAWVCACRTKLAFTNDHAKCEACGNRYALIGNAVRRT